MDAPVYKKLVDIDKTLLGGLDGLVKIPFRSGHFSTEQGGTAVANFNDGGQAGNEDGSATSLALVCPTGINNGVSIRIPFYGRVFGLRWRRDTSAPDFSVSIDGVAYKVSAQHTYYNNDGINTLTDSETLMVIANDLNDGVHYAQITLTFPASGTSTLVLYGLLLERRAGYSEKPRVSLIGSSGSVPTTSTAIPKGSDSGVNQLRYIRKVLYVNTTASPITISIYNQTTLIWQKSVLANDTIEFDPASPLSAFTSYGYLKQQASVAGVNYVVIGGV